MFDILDLTGHHDWFLDPAFTWHLAPEFKQLDIFSRNLVEVNDLAERGIHLASSFIKRVESEEQRKALFQVAEDFRKKVDFSKDIVKYSLKSWLFEEEKKSLFFPLHLVNNAHILNLSLNIDVFR